MLLGRRRLRELSPGWVCRARGSHQGPHQAEATEGLRVTSSIFLCLGPNITCRR